MIDLGVDEQELDFTGWELRKFLRLFAGSNATPYEWVQSPIVYLEVGDFRARIQALFADYFNARSVAFHYLGLAKRSLEKGLVGEQMDIKKYFYVLRPLLAARWILETESAAPMEFAPLLARLEANTALYTTLLELTQAKMKAQEGDKIAPIPIVQKFIEEALTDYPDRARNLPSSNGQYEPLDHLFRNLLTNHADH